MSCRTLILGLVVAAMAFSVSCTFPPVEQPRPYTTIPNIHAGQTTDDVIKALGHPTARENGWWVGNSRWAIGVEGLWFDMDFHVWYYKKVGRVIFYLRERELFVYTSEADDQQLGRTDQSSEPVRRYPRQ